jgi:hypothetical protein
MNDIGIGIFCFGEEYYYKGTMDKVNRFIKNKIHCYVLTENPSYFNTKLSSSFLHTIWYDKTFKSYHDKLILPKIILKNREYCILIDADTDIKDDSVIDILKTYNFKEGISYIDTLMNHIAKREYVKDLISDGVEWISYKPVAQIMYPNYTEFKTIWEYFLVINKNGFNQNKFYKSFEKLAIAKNYSDLQLNKEVSGAGEGISIEISAKVSETNIERDEVLFELLKDNLVSISKRHTSPKFWPVWMR